MKNLLLLSVLLSATTMQAQSFRSQIINWEDRPLRLDDFMGKKSKNDTTTFSIYWIINSKTEKIKVPGGKLAYQKTYLSMDQGESYIVKERQNEGMLRLCQTSFDLMEAYRRKIEYDRVDNPDVSYSSILRYYYRHYEEQIDEMTDSTDFGQNAEMLDRYAAEVDSMLALPEIEPTQIPLGSRHFAIDIFAGYNLRYTSNDFYTSAPSGICVGYTMDIRRHLVGMDVNCNWGGKSKHDFYTDRGPIGKGEKIEALHLLFQYGYLLNLQGKNDFYPLFNLGLTNMTGKSTTNDSGKEETPALQGFCLGIGCRYDIPLFTSTRLNNGPNNMIYTNWSGNRFYSASRSRFSLQLRPKILFTKMESASGWYPSFNLSLTLSWNSIVYTAKGEQ